MQEPNGGFSTPELQTLFVTQRNTAPSIEFPSPPATPPEQATSSPVSPAAIAGGVVGGIAALALVAGIAIFLVRRRKRRQAIELPPDSRRFPPAYEKGNGDFYEMSAKDSSTAELAAKHNTQELPGVVPVYELPEANSRASSRQNGSLEVGSRARSIQV
jgi:hypothetical protein